MPGAGAGIVESVLRSLFTDRNLTAAPGALDVSPILVAIRGIVSEATVKTHVNRIFAKTGSRDRPQAMRYAYTHGYADPGAG
jgi:hypothetical protein